MLTSFQVVTGITSNAVDSLVISLIISLNLPKTVNARLRIHQQFVMHVGAFKNQYAAGKIELTNNNVKND